MHTVSGNWITEGTFDREYYNGNGELFWETKKSLYLNHSNRWVVQGSKLRLSNTK